MNRIDIKREVLNRLDQEFIKPFLSEIQKSQIFSININQLPNTTISILYKRINDKYNLDTVYETVEKELTPVRQESVNQYGIPRTQVDEITAMVQSQLNSQREKENKQLQGEIENAKLGPFYMPDLDIQDNFALSLTQRTKSIRIPYYPANMFVVDVIGDGNCFFHSFLTAIKDKEYREASNARRREIAKEFRKYMIELLDGIDPNTGEEYSRRLRLSEDIVIPDDIVVKSKREKGQLIPVVEIRKSTMDIGGLTKSGIQRTLVKEGCTEYIGLEGIELLLGFFTFQTIILNTQYKPVVNLELFDSIPEDRPILVFLYSGNHYEPIGENIEYRGQMYPKLIFTKDDTFIQSIYAQFSQK